MATCIAWQESRLQPQVVSENNHYVGLFQIDYALHGQDKEELKLPHHNIKVARLLYDERGWDPWPTSHSMQ